VLYLLKEMFLFKKQYHVLIFSLALGVSGTFSCRKTHKSESYSPPQTSKLTGKELAQAYCASCHEYVPPQLLDKTSWQQGVLPKMHTRLGLEKDIFGILSKLELDEMTYVAAAGVYPEHPQITEEDWQKIVNFYLTTAPERLSGIDNYPKPKILSGFSIVKSNQIAQMPAITMLHVDSSSGQIYAGIRGDKHYLVQYNNKLLAQDSTLVKSPITDLTIINKNIFATLVGKMDPNDKRIGQFVKIDSQKKVQIIEDSLQRPVHTAFGDLSGDGQNDMVICEFGNELGKVHWYDFKTKKSTALNYLPGARVAYIKDMNADGLNDIVLLCTQAKEQVLIYYNTGKGRFQETVVLRFAPVWGSSYITLADMDSDGLTDIVHTNGDNADLSPVLKPYHGLRIFKNFGKNSFKEHYFYPLHGASKVQVEDFDQDGRLDMALSSFFPNYKEPTERGFVLLKQTAINKFDSFVLPALGFGKWMTMTTGDIDKDGDIDIVLGSFLGKGLRVSDELKYKKNIELVILKNNLR
jgi:hypothetical protein